MILHWPDLLSKMYGTYVGLYVAEIENPLELEKDLKVGGSKIPFNFLTHFRSKTQKYFQRYHWDTIFNFFYQKIKQLRKCKQLVAVTVTFLGRKILQMTLTWKCWDDTCPKIRILTNVWTKCLECDFNEILWCLDRHILEKRGSKLVLGPLECSICLVGLLGTKFELDFEMIQALSGP